MIRQTGNNFTVWEPFHSSLLPSESLYAGNTVRGLKYFIICHIVASFSASKPCVVAGAVSQAGRCLALTRRQFEETFLSLAMVKEAFHPSPILDPLVTQDLPSLQECASRQRPGSLIALDVEVDNKTSVEALSFSAFSVRTSSNRLIYGACLFGCFRYTANKAFAFASWGYVQFLFLSKMRHAILMVTTMTKTIPWILPPDTRQKALVESQPVIAWSPGRNLHSFSPKAWAMSCTGIIWTSQTSKMANA